MPSRGRNCSSLLRLKLISRSLPWLGSNIIAFHPGGQKLIPDIILIYAVVLIVKVISSIILILFILYVHILYVYITSNRLRSPQKFSLRPCGLKHTLFFCLPVYRYAQASLENGWTDFHETRYVTSVRSDLEYSLYNYSISFLKIGVY